MMDYESDYYSKQSDCATSFGQIFKATNCTTGYHVAWWIATVGSCIGWLVDATFSFMKASVFVGCDKE